MQSSVSQKGITASTALCDCVCVRATEQLFQQVQLSVPSSDGGSRLNRHQASPQLALTANSSNGYFIFRNNLRTPNTSRGLAEDGVAITNVAVEGVVAVHDAQSSQGLRDIRCKQHKPAGKPVEPEARTRDPWMSGMFGYPARWELRPSTETETTYLLVSKVELIGTSPRSTTQHVLMAIVPVIATQVFSRLIDPCSRNE